MSARKLLSKLALFGATGALAVIPAQAQEFTFNMTHHLAPQAIGHRLFLEPWAQKIEEESNGRIHIEIFPAMQLGGTAADVYSQVRDGVVDLGWTLPGYSGLFPITEVFELPFVAGPAEATAPALMEFYDEYLQDEWSDVKVLALHATAPGGLHTAEKPAQTVGDLAGMKIRAPSSIGVATIEALGAAPIGMPVPQVYEALERNLVDGALLPWTIMGPTRIYEATRYSTDLSILASTFALFMNKDAYESLPDDLKKVIEDNSGMELAKQAGVLWDEDEMAARDKALEAGVEILVPSDEELAAWKEATKPVLAGWVESMNARGLPGDQMLEDAQSLIRKYQEQ